MPYTDQNLLRASANLSQVNVKKPKEFGLADLIPAAGGLIGGAAGTVLGPVGTIGGGSLGSAVGEYLRQQVEGEDTDFGNVLKEGGIGLLGGAVGEGLGLGARAIGLAGRGAAKVGAKAGEEAIAGATAKTALKEGTKENLLQSAGRALRTKVVNPKVAAGPFGSAGEREIVDTLGKLNVGGPAVKQYDQIGKVFESLNGKIGQKLASSTAKYPVETVQNELLKDLADNPLISLSENTLGKYGNAISKISKGGNEVSVQDLFKYKKDLGKMLERAFKNAATPGAALTPEQEAGLSVWRNIDSLITQAEPGVKDLTKLQSTLFDASPGLAASRSGGVKVPLVGNLPGRRLGQSAVDYAGRGLTNAGNRVAQGATKLGRAGSAVVGQSLVSGLRGNGRNPGVPEPDPLAPDQAAPFEEQGLQGEEPQQSQSPFNQAAINKLIISDIARTGGKNLAAIQMLQKLTQSQAAKPTKLSDTAIKTVSDLKNGISQLESLSGTLTENSGDLGPFIGAIKASIPGTRAQTTQASIDTARQIVGKALEGGVLRKEDEDKYKKILPVISDTPSVAQNKIKLLTTILKRNLSQYGSLQNSRGGGTFDVASLAAPAE